MSLVDRVRAALRGTSAPKIRVKLFVSGRIGGGWQSIDRTIALPPGSTLGTLIDAAERDGIELRRILEESRHLRHTLMLNGERCAVAENLERALADGDQVSLLSPMVGG